MTEDPYLKRYQQLRKIALPKGFDLCYSRRRANLADVLLDGMECEAGALTGEEQLHLVRGDDHVIVWVSSNADAATVFQEATDRMVEQIVVCAKEFVGAED